VELPPQALNDNEVARPRLKGFTAQLIMEFGNMVVPREGVLRFTAIVDGSEVYEAPGLEFARSPNAGQS